MEFSKFNEYDVKDKKAIRYYNTVNDMKNDNTLKENMFVETKGYYNANDEGNGKYYITSNEDNTYFQEVLQNGLYATLIFDKYVNVKQLGAKGDNETDDTLIFQNALSKYTKVYVPKGSYLINDTLTLNNYTEFYGSGYETKLYFDTSIAISFDKTMPILMCNIHDFYFQGNSDNTCFDIERPNASVALTRSTFKNIYAKSFDVGVLAYETWVLSFINVTFSSCTKSVQLGAQSNCIDFINCSLSGNSRTTTSNCSYCSNAQMVKFDTCNIYNEFFINIRNNSEVYFVGCYFENLNNHQLLSTGNSNNMDKASHITIDHCHGYQFDIPLKLLINNSLNNELINNSIYNNFCLESNNINIGNYKFNNEKIGEIYCLINGRNITTLNRANSCEQSLIGKDVVISGASSTAGYIFRLLDKPIPANTNVRIQMVYARNGSGSSALRLTNEDSSTTYKNFTLLNTCNEEDTPTLKYGVAEFHTENEIKGLRITNTFDNLYIKYLVVSTQGKISEIENIDNTDLITKSIPTFFNGKDYIAHNYSDGTEYKYYNNEWH